MALANRLKIPDSKTLKCCALVSYSVTVIKCLVRAAEEGRAGFTDSSRFVYHRTGKSQHQEPEA